MLLNYVDEEVEDTVLKSKEEWDALKNNLGLNFPNLPYLIDDEVKLSQSSAILRYLGRKHKLNGKNDKEACEIDMLIETSTDLRITLGPFINHKDTISDFFKTLDKTLVIF